ncbi:gefF [Symbiodinium natans]|uniref:GefF protein n=1 Tax=Symbiodinium natans TaxID=878477 RepID=A0A812JAU8_9DINO|nr:gefF [Symbiodinium natans]
MVERHGPASRSGHTMVWDSGADGAGEGFLMYGGLLDSAMSGDLYFFGVTSNLWTQKSSGPAARYRHSAVIDPTARAMYIFAGMSLSAGTASTFGDLHRYDVDLDSWTALQGTAGRSRHTAVWDSSSDRMIVFGGVDGMLNKTGDVLEYDRSSDSWSFPQVEGPAARDGHVAVWDDTTGAMLMCCGVTSDSGQSLGDLWSYDGTWAQLSPSGGITARRYASAVWDPQARAMLGFGGRETPEAALNSLFLYSTSANSWSEYTVSGAPSYLGPGATAWDPVNSHLYTYGGLEQGPKDSLWRYCNFNHRTHSYIHNFFLIVGNFILKEHRNNGDRSLPYCNFDHKHNQQLFNHNFFLIFGNFILKQHCNNINQQFVNHLTHSYIDNVFLILGNFILKEQQLVATLGNSSNSSGILGRALTQSHLATIQTLALQLGVSVRFGPDSLAISDMSRNVTVQSASASVEVPPDVVAQAAAAGGSGLVLLSVSVGLEELGAGLNGSEGGAGNALVSRPVSITFRGPDGQRIPMPSLARPIEVLILGATEGSRCAFWDEDTGTWSSEGLRAVSFRDGELLCQTSHLTVFGAVLETFLHVLRCSTAAQVFSAEGLQNLSKGTWPGHAAAIITFSALFICLLLLLYALRLDRKRSLSRKQVKAALLIELDADKQDAADGYAEEEEEEVKAEKARQPSVCRQAAARLASSFAWLLSQMFDIPDDLLTELMNAKVVTINRCISSLHAYKSHADRQSIRAAERLVGHARLQHSTTASMSVTIEDFVRMDQTTDYRRSKSLVAKNFLNSFWCKRVVLLMWAMHPWITMQFVSLFRSHVVRASLIILKLVSAACANALFFTSSAVAADADMNCAPLETTGERLLRAAIVGILSACMGDLLIVLLAMVQRRQVLIRRWTEEAKERQLRSWRRRRFIFWLIWFPNLGISILYVFGFLANVSQADGAKWIESTGMSLLQDLVLKPLCLALLYATVASMVLCCSPSVGEKILNQWALNDKESENEDLQNDGNQLGNEDFEVLERNPSVAEQVLEQAPPIFRAVLTGGAAHAGSDYPRSQDSSAEVAYGGHTMVWDSGADGAGEGFLMLGGELSDSAMSGDLYFYGATSNQWTLKSSGPAARYHHSAVIDPTARAMYIFAGMSLGSGTVNTFGDLHRYDVDLDSWTELQGLPGTAGRSRHTAVWDSSSDRMIVFGGVDGMQNKMGDILEYDRSSDSWSFPQVEGPAARDGHVAVWDDATGAMLMCCGVTSDSGQSLGDLWSYDGTWAQLSPSGGITARRYASAVWDPQARAMLGFGGRATPETALNSLFLYSASANSWSEYTASGTPAFLGPGATAWDPVNSHLYTFGGLEQQGPRDSLWRYCNFHKHHQQFFNHLTHSYIDNFFLILGNFILKEQYDTDCKNIDHKHESTATTSTEVYPATITDNAGLLLGDLDTSEGELARQLVATLGNSSNSTGILGSTLTQSDLATIQTLALQLGVSGHQHRDSLAISDMSRNITVQSASASVEVPPDVVAQAAAAGGSGLVLLSVSVGLEELGAGLNGSEGGAGNALVSRPVSITFRGPDGQRIPMPSLARPIEVLILGATEGSRCAFWDEELRSLSVEFRISWYVFVPFFEPSNKDTGAWSSEGLRAVSFRDGELLCQTSHLTVFGAVLETFLHVLRCSTAAQVFSAEGLQNLSKGTGGGHLARPCCCDHYLQRCLAEQRAVGMVKKVAEALVVSKEKVDAVVEKLVSGRCKKQVKAALLIELDADKQDAADGYAEEEEEEVKAEKVAHASGEDANDGCAQQAAELVKKSALAAAADTSFRMIRDARTSSVVWSIRTKSSMVTDMLAVVECCRRLGELRVAHQPLRCTDALTVGMTLVGVQRADAAVDRATRKKTPSAPRPENAVWESLLIVLLAMVQRRQVLIRRWTEEAKERQLRSWRRRRFIFWLIWFPNVGLSILYVLGFLANVSQADGAKWIESTGMSLLQDLVLKPLCLALLYATVASTVLCCSPSVGEKILNQWVRQSDNESGNEDLQNDCNQLRNEDFGAPPGSHALRPACEEDDTLDAMCIDSV